MVMVIFFIILEDIINLNHFILIRLLKNQKEMVDYFAFLFTLIEQDFD